MGFDFSSNLIYGINTDDFCPPSWWKLVDSCRLSLGYKDLRNESGLDRVFGISVNPAKIEENGIKSCPRLVRFKELCEKYLYEDYQPHLYTTGNGDCEDECPDKKYHRSNMFYVFLGTRPYVPTEEESKELVKIRRYERKAWKMLAKGTRIKEARREFIKFFEEGNK